MSGGAAAVRGRPAGRRGLALSAALAARCSLLLCGCVGPNFHRPAPPQVLRYTAAPLPAQTAAALGPGGDAQRFLTETDLPRHWWTLFDSERLNALVGEALHANPDVMSAEAALRQALENAAAQRGSYAPAVQGSFAAGRELDAVGVLSPNLTSGAAMYDLFTPQVSVSYVPDIFGVNRRQVESLAAQAEASRFQLDATYLTLAANVVAAAVEEAGLREQIAATMRIISLQRESVGILQGQLRLGAIAEADVFAQDAALAQVESTLPPLQRQLHQVRDQLAVLTGHLPADFQPPELTLSELVLPDLPLGVASQLVERRPDVRAAEAQLHAATALVGVAIGNMLPQFTITGTIGSSATALGDLFKPGTGFWSLGADVTQTVFAGGTLLHRKRAADAALDQAAAGYRSAVLTAFQNVADALHALTSDAELLQAASRAEAAAQKSLGVARQQLDLGSVGYLALVAAELTYQQAVVTTIQARTSRFADTAALFQALGGSIGPVAAPAAAAR